MESERVDIVLSKENPMSGETEIREWNAKESKARNLIIQSVSDGIFCDIRKENTEAKLMKALECSFA